MQHRHRHMTEIHSKCDDEFINSNSFNYHSLSKATNSQGNQYPIVS